MEADRHRWNAKYRSQTYATKASDIVKRFYRLAPQGAALDIAAGNGRNSLFLARRGFAVDAVDIADAAAEGLNGRHPAVRCIRDDLDAYMIPPGRYSLIVNVRYLNRRLFPYIIEGLTPGGILIFESFLQRPEGIGDGPSCPDHLLRENELLRAFLPLHIVFYQEAQKTVPKGDLMVASLVGRRKG
jgi:SAM-dependent methyltransferase